jgi:importin-9
LVSQLLPSLVQSLEAATANAQESWLASSALELIAGVLQGGEKGKLGDGLVAGLAPSLFDCINASQDRDVTVVSLVSPVLEIIPAHLFPMRWMLQKGTECIALIVRKGCDQLLSWNDRAGRSGLDNVLAFVARLLSPTENEASGLLVGDLIIHLLRNTGEAILPILPQLLQTMVNRIPTAKTATFLQVNLPF